MVDTLQQTRDELRTKIKQQRKALSDTNLKSAGARLLDNCVQFIDGKTSVAGYQAINGEIPLNVVFDYCHKNNITTLLPIMRNKALMFAPFDRSTSFSIKQYGIQEPDVPESDWLSPQQLDLVLVPLVAFDKTCNRMGMGGGFYDRSFEFRKSRTTAPALVGVAHALQQVEDVLPQSWDVPLDFVATDIGVITQPNESTYK